MNIKINKIGVLDHGIDGYEEYLLLTNTKQKYSSNTTLILEDTLTEAQAWAHIHPLVYHDTDVPAAYFCHTVKCMQKTDSQVLAIVYHQYNN